MTAYMLDANICSFIIRKRPPVVIERLQAAMDKRDAVCISTVVYYEMRGSGLGTRYEPLIQQFLARVTSVAPWDHAAATQSARLWNALRAAGTPIGGADTMIAGHALALGCTLVTNNTREFERVPGLRVEDWVIPQAA